MNKEAKNELTECGMKLMNELVEWLKERLEWNGVGANELIQWAGLNKAKNEWVDKKNVIKAEINQFAEINQSIKQIKLKTFSLFD